MVKIAIVKRKISVGIFNGWWLMVIVKILSLKSPLSKEDLKDKIVNRYN